MGFYISTAESFRSDPGIYLRTRESGMAEQFLHGPQISAATQEMSRKTVT